MSFLYSLSSIGGFILRFNSWGLEPAEEPWLLNGHLVALFRASCFVNVKGKRW